MPPSLTGYRKPTNPLVSAVLAAVVAAAVIVDALVSVTNLIDNAIFDQCGLLQPGRTFRIQLRLF